MATKIQNEWWCHRCNMKVNNAWAHGGLDCPNFVSNGDTRPVGWSMVSNMPKDLANALRRDKIDIKLRDMEDSIQGMKKKYRTKHWSEKADWSRRRN